MSQQLADHTTGLPSLDEALSRILAGDNIVWHVERIEDYQAFVGPYVRAARRDRRRLVYFRFARHAPLLDASAGVETHVLDPEDGFETFIHRIHRVIGEAGTGAYYVFDCLTDLAVDWYSDAMLGNFFMLTCPYLFELQTIAYFGLLRHRHSRQATAPILDTTQLFLDVFRCQSVLHVRALKTQFRYTPTIHMLHAWRPDDTFERVTSSAVTAQVLAVGGSPWATTDEQGERAFSRAEEIVALRGTVWYTPEQESEVRHQIVRALVTRDPAMLALVEQHLRMEDLLDIRKRLVGSGLIGGKAVGMLVARRILATGWAEADTLLEPHDSFYIGSDVFYTYLVRNKIWSLREKQRHPETFLRDAAEARARIETGGFPDYILRQFEDLLDYFGQYPVIVRSSSLLEDNYGNAFAGKYESVFCANQGPREQRLAAFVAAVKTVYASTMSTEALSYRARHGLLDRDEQMALLVMRVSGAMHGRCFYPHLAGVGFSYNPFPWSPAVDPAAGVIRLVYGLGTRAVDRVDDDYTRVVALNAPSRRPESGFEEICRHSQRHVDYIDLDAGRLATGEFIDLIQQGTDVPVSVFASVDPHAGGRQETWILTFERLLAETRFVEDMRTAIKTLEVAYGHPVDIEFAANFIHPAEYRINLLQCRPLKVQGVDAVDVPWVEAPAEAVLLAARGAVVGMGRVAPVDRVVFVVPACYAALAERDRHAVARVIGEINRACGRRGGITLLAGPGRWGTSTPSLGVPVNFSEINHVNVLCELATMHATLTPDVSLGTHFFNELVEMNMLYFALFPGREGNGFDADSLVRAPNRLADYAPENGKWADCIRVVEPAEPLRLIADPRTQRVVCYRAV
ncbi:MAG: PEP/pyruvate-binding domain-containing protein [bacterium]